MTTGGAYMSSPLDHSENVRLCMRLSQNENKDIYRYNRNKSKSFTLIKPPTPYANRSTSGYIGGGAFEPHKSPGILNYCSLQDPNLDEYFARKFSRMLSPHLPLRDNFYSSLDAQKLGLRSNSFRNSQYLSNNNEVLYKIAVTTADVKGAGTNIPVYISIRGDKCNLSRTRLKKPSKKNKKTIPSKFSSGSTQIFPIRCNDLGDLESILIEHDGLEPKDSWLLQGIEIMNVENKKIWLFTCNHWLSLYKEDGKVSRELFAFKSIRTKYEIVVITGDVSDAGTDCKVFISLCGRTGVSPQIPLVKENKVCFQRGESNKFIIPATCVGPITKIRIRLDESGSHPSWYLDRICITDLKNPEWRYFFQCKNWLSKSHGDHALVREIRGSKEIMGIATRTHYKISFYTENKAGAGTRADIYIQLFGETGESEVINIKNPDGIKEGSIFEHEIPLRELGTLKKIKVGHNNKGPQPRWFLNKVIINDLHMSRVFEFPCGFWLSDSDGEELERVVPVKKMLEKYNKFLYETKITTGNRSKASTTSAVYIILSGPEIKDKVLDKIESSGKIWIKEAKFLEGCTDIVPIELNLKLSPLTQVSAGINAGGKKADWFLEDIIIFCPHTGIEQTFICGNWLSSTKTGCTPEVLLVEDLSKRKIKTIKETWMMTILTSDVKQAGTSAKVTIVLYGNEGKSDDIHISTEKKLEQNSTIDFRTELAPVGLPYKLRVQHDNSGVNPSWNLDKILMTLVSTGDIYQFECRKWLSDSHEDNSIIREIPATGPGIHKPAPICKYKIQIFTGGKMYAGTDANVFINLYGEKGDTGDRFLTHSFSNRNKFERNQMDDFVIEAVKLGKINKIKLGHDSALAGSGWFVDKVIIFEEQDPTNSVTFRCNCWFDSDEVDGLTVREITGTNMLGRETYDVEVVTGKVSGAGTDSNVFIRMFGTVGETGPLQLKTSSTNKNKFETGNIDLFKIDSEDIGEVKSIRLSHDNKGAAAAWFVDRVCVIVHKLGLKYIFNINKWLDKKHLELDLDPSKIETIDKTIPYQITVYTGDVTHAGTDAQVFLQIYGKDKKTDQLQLKSNSNNFQKGSEDVFKINANEVGPIQKIRIGHDGKKPGAGWYLEKICIERIPTKITTGPNIKTKNKLQKSKAYSSDSSLDSLDNNSLSLSRSISNRSDQEEDEIEKYWFFCKRWLATDEDDGMIVRELLPTDKHGQLLSDLTEINYYVDVKTGKEFGSGTDANVFLTIYGKQGDSGERALKNTIDSKVNKFEENNLDKFLIKAVDLGNIEKIKIRHDNSNGGAAWYLDYIFINNEKDDYLFPCYSWLAKDKDDGLIAREIFPANALVYKDWQNGNLTKEKFQIFQEDKLETFEVKVYTTKKMYAGTDSNVYIILYGENNDSGIIPLKNSRTHSNKFESGNCDEFIIKSADLGELKKIRIGHDNSVVNSDWHLAKVDIEAQKRGQSYVFPCNEWISKSKGDGKLERELYPQLQLTLIKRPKINYEITTYTSNRSKAGTNANVYIQIYGRQDCTEKKILADPVDKNRFEKGVVGIFHVALEDVDDPIEKIRIGHDGKGIGAGWHLEKVLVKRLLADKTKSLTYEFPCNRWLARDEEDGAIERELIPEKVIRRGSVNKLGESIDKVDNIASILQKKSYIIRVYTGNETGTNAKVFLKVFGDTGDSGERQLVDSKTHTDKFEKNNMDEFEWEAVDLGKLIKVEIRHDNSGLIKKDWFLKKIEIIDKYDNEMYLFHCERWLSKSKDNKKIQRTLYVAGYRGDKSTSSTGRSRSIHSGSGNSIDSSKDDSLSGMYNFEKDDNNKTNTESIPYTITIVTGPDKNMGSTGPFWIKFYGDKDLKTHPIRLTKLGSNLFAPGSTEIMSVEAADIGDIKKVEIANEGVDRESSWFLKSLIIEIPTKGKLYNIVCGTWLSKFEGDRSTSRVYNIIDKMMTKISKKITYTISVITGDIDRGGTNSSLFLQLFGTTGNSSVYPLDKNEDNFERGNRDMFKLEMEDVGTIKKIRLQNDSDGDRPDWFLEKVDITNEKTNEFYEFEYNDFLSKNVGQKKKLVIDIAPNNDSKKTDYKILVKTSDIKSAGTSSGVFIKLYGEFGDSGELPLKTPEKTGTKPFKINQLDEFVFTDMLVLGDLTRCQVWHNNNGFSNKWHLEYIEVKELNSRRSWTFPCNKWLSLSEDDKQIFRELICTSAPTTTKKTRNESSYEIKVITGDRKNAGIPHNVWFIFYGSKNYSEKFVMENSEMEKLFSRSNEDKRKFTCSFIGELNSMKMGAVINKREINSDRKKWYCHEVQVKDLVTLKTYTFEIKSWIDVFDKINEKEGKDFDPVRVEEDINKARVEEIKKKGVIKYEIIVVTGKGVGCGTNANVFITLYGENTDSGKRPLVQKGRDLFEQGQEDKFILECVDLGTIEKIKIEHDDSGLRSDWFLERVQVVNLSNNTTWRFDCQQWLSKSKNLWKILTPN